MSNKIHGPRARAVPLPMVLPLYKSATVPENVVCRCILRHRAMPFDKREQPFHACTLICHVSAGERAAARVHRMTNQEICLYSSSCNPLYRFRLTGSCHSLRGCTVTSALEVLSSFPPVQCQTSTKGKGKNKGCIRHPYAAAVREAQAPILF